MARLKVLFVASECMPLAKSGGLGDVVSALPHALRRRGHDVRVLIPRYRETKSHPAHKLPAPFGIPTGFGDRWTALWESTLKPDLPVYLLEHDALFDRSGLYGDARGDFGDNVFRFALLSRAALLLPRYLGWNVDVIHVHDWQASLVPVYARAIGSPIPTVLSIHNMGYQGHYGADQLPATGLGTEWFDARGLEYLGDINLLKGGILHATYLSTVSPRYAFEIQTPEGGAGLDGVLRYRRAELVGILNGIDEEQWDPRTDPHLPARFGPDDLSGKAVCKAALQREMGLEERADVPLIGLVSRFVEQKGIDVFAAAMQRLLHHDLQFVVLGSGEGWAEELFRRLSATSWHVRARIGFDEGLAHRIEAGADLFVMPSRYEPCGLNQMYSQRYGTLPIVRAVGGLYDTVEHERTGFVFEHLSGDALAATVRWAADTVVHRPAHHRFMQVAAMRKPMGWDRSAAQYEALYRLAMARRAGRR